MSLQTFCGDGDGRNWACGFDFVLKSYKGGWREACELNRRWLEKPGEGSAVKAKLPDWTQDSPITVIYAVKGEGIDHGPEELGPNRYYPYSTEHGGFEVKIGCKIGWLSV